MDEIWGCEVMLKLSLCEPALNYILETRVLGEAGKFYCFDQQRGPLPANALKTMGLGGGAHEASCSQGDTERLCAQEPHRALVGFETTGSLLV